MGAGLRQFFKSLFHPRLTFRLISEGETLRDKYDGLLAEYHSLKEEISALSLQLQQAEDKTADYKERLKSHTIREKDLLQEIEYLKEKSVSEEELNSAMQEIELKLREATRLKHGYENKIRNLELRLDDALSRIRKQAGIIQTLEAEKLLPSSPAAQAPSSPQPSNAGKPVEKPRPPKDGSGWWRPLPDSI